MKDVQAEQLLILRRMFTKLVFHWFHPGIVWRSSVGPVTLSCIKCGSWEELLLHLLLLRLPRYKVHVGLDGVPILVLI